MRFNGWQRLWMVVSVAITAAIVWQQIGGHNHTEAASDRFNLDTVTALRNPACAEYANAPWQNSWKELSFSEPCQVVLIVRDFVPNHAPLTEAYLAAKRQRNAGESYWPNVWTGLATGLILSLLLYAFGWIAAKAFKWLARVLKPQG
jgi:hypothetical protein